MRDIKFRALADIQTGPNEFKEGFVYGGIYIHDEVCKYITTKDFDFISTKKDSIGQYTGLKDVNGVEIYEGDIVESDYYPPDIEEVAEIYYCLEDARYKAKSGEQDAFTYGNLTVIGNIHQNPELLEK